MSWPTLKHFGGEKKLNAFQYRVLYICKQSLSPKGIGIEYV